jgi:excisionase family DNA binding protein
MSKKLLTVREVVDLISINRTTIYQLIERGELPALRIRGSIRVRPEALEAWLATCEIPKPRGRKRTDYRPQPHTINTSIDAPSLH